jgi:NTP pyrophosphatase (non-canonical NTP hydrolase)
MGDVPNGAIGAETWPGLSKLTEECGEVLQVVGKLAAFPGAMRHPDGSDLPERLLEELGDVLAAVQYVVWANGLDGHAVDQRASAKLHRFRHWHHEERAPTTRANPEREDRA